MRKTLRLLLLLCAVLPFTASAQLNETFSNLTLTSVTIGTGTGNIGGLPTGWSQLNVDNLTPDASLSYMGTNAWISRQIATSATTFDTVAQSISWYAPAGTSNDYLISPLMMVANANTYLTWTGYAPDASFPDGYTVKISTTGTAATDFTTTFNVQIPVYKAKQYATKAPTNNRFQSIESSETIRILVVEDNLFNQKLVEKSIQLTLKNSTIHIAEDGEKALQCLTNNEYDVILMDIQMPVLNGFETTQIIRSKFPFPKNQTPILALTANVLKSEVEKCFEYGMNDYISKPFKIPELIKKIVAISKK
jgi:CheY-like chemotaxis protein